MQTLTVVRPRFAEIVNSSWLSRLSVRAFASSDHLDQSRGGLPRFYSEVLPPSKGNVVRVQGDEFWHMTKVLRLSKNDRVELFNGKGGLVEGCIQSIDRTGLDVVALYDPKLIPPQSSQWHVFAGFGQRLHEMVLKPPSEIDALLNLIAQSKLSLIATAKASPVLGVLTSLTKETNGGLIIIGPEGDFTEKEVRMIMEAGATSVGLGPHRLRVETATISLLATVTLWSDSQQRSIC